MMISSSSSPENKQLPYKILNFPSENSPQCVITLYSAGDMGRNINPDIQNRRKIADQLGAKTILALNQKHTKTVYSSEELDGKFPEGDGLITNSRQAIAVTVADCVPIFLYDAKTGAYGVVHSGWKGTGIALTALKKMENIYGTKSKDIQVIIGPSIGACCYAVDKERAKSFALEWGSDTSFFRDSEYYIDLKKANFNLLKNAGVETIIIDSDCTCCGKNYHSYRRDGSDTFGLMLAITGYFI